MKKLVFATCREQPDLQPSDRLLAAALRDFGVETAPAPWNGPQAPFEEADGVVVRSTWDYPAAPVAFIEWLETLGRLDVVVNPPALMRWNIDKRYLLDLASRGAPLPPTRLVEPAPEAIAAAMDALGVDEAVVKPVIGATASGLSRVRRRDGEGLAQAARALGGKGLVQPVLDEIKTRGETSMMFADGVFTHAVVKRAKDEEIRVQAEFGGVVAPVEPPSWAIRESARLLDLVPRAGGDAPTYARVDAIILDAALWLMEVELVEPELFFIHAPAAATIHAEAIAKKLK